MKTDWKNLHTGNVVRWSKSLYVVSSVSNTNGVINLIPFNHSNVTAHPSLTWPEDEYKRIDSIKLVSRSVRDYITKSLTKSFKF